MIETDALTRHARRKYHVMTGGLVLLAITAAVLTAATLARPGKMGAHLAAFAGHPDAPVALWQTLGLLTVAILHLAVWAMLFQTARIMFRHLAYADPDAAAGTALRLSRWLWVMLGWGIVSGALASMLASWGYPDGQRALAVNIGSSELLMALTALIAGFMARAFALGAELWRDHRAVI